MGKFFRLHRSSLRSKISYVVVLGFAIAALVLSINPGTTFGADPTFNSPVSVAPNHLYYDMNLRIRPTDGRAFIIGAKGDSVGLSANDPNNPTNPPGYQNIKFDNADYAVKYPNIAFAANGTGYAVWRLQNAGLRGNNEAFLRVIPPAYNGINNFNLGAGFYLTDKIGTQLDQPTVAVASNGDVLVAGYLVGDPVRLALVTFDSNINAVKSIVTVAAQPAGFRSEMDPEMCVDSSDNVHIVSLFPLGGVPRLVAFSRVGGGSFDVQDITASGYDGRDGIGLSGKDIACAADGTTYIAAKRGGQYDFYRRPAGAGQSWGLGGNHQPNQSNVFGSTQATSLAITTSLDGRVWFAEGDGIINGNGRPGTYVKYSDNQGDTILPAGTGAIPAIPQSTYTNAAVAIDGKGPGGKVYVAGTFNGQQPETTFYTFANTLLPAPINLTATANSSKQITLNWSFSAPTPDSYRIYRSLPNQNSGFTQIASGVVGTSYPDLNLPYGTTYYYYVTTVKSGFPESAASNTASATTFAPYSVQFNSSPNTGASGANLSPQPSVTVLDQQGQTVTNYNGPVTLSIAPGTGTSGATLSSTTSTTQTASGGVLAFSGNFSIDKLGVYRLRATTDTGAFGDSALFTLTGTLLFEVGANPGIPASINATEPFTVTVTVQQGSPPATATDYTGPVYLAFNPNNGAYFYGQTTVFAGIVTAGKATFTNLMIDTAGSGYTLTASLPANLALPLQSAAFTVTGNPPSCSRWLYSQTAPTPADACSGTDLPTVLSSAVTLPVYVDHRTASGFTGQATFTLPSNLTLLSGAKLDGGCNTPGGIQGLKIVVTSANKFILGGNNFLRGIYFSGSSGSGPVLSVQSPSQTGNSISCSKVGMP